MNCAFKPRILRNNLIAKCEGSSSPVGMYRSYHESMYVFSLYLQFFSLFPAQNHPEIYDRMSYILHKCFYLVTICDTLFRIVFPSRKSHKDFSIYLRGRPIPDRKRFYVSNRISPLGPSGCAMCVVCRYVCLLALSSVVHTNELRACRYNKTLIRP